MKKMSVISLCWNGMIGFDSAKDASDAYQALAKGIGVTSNYIDGKSVYTQENTQLKMESVNFVTETEFLAMKEEVKRKEEEKLAKIAEEEAAKIAEEAAKTTEEVSNDKTRTDREVQRGCYSGNH